MLDFILNSELKFFSKGAIAISQRTIDTTERLPLLQTIPLSLQHLFAMFGSTVLVPILFQIKETSPSWQEAKRLLKFLDYMLPISPEFIPQNSIVREFIGGSCLDVG